MTEFNPNWPRGHVTRDGKKAVILDADYYGSDGERFVAKIEVTPGKWATYEFYSGGKFVGDRDDRFDLMNVPAPANKLYTNVYKDEYGVIFVHGVFLSRQEALHDSFNKDEKLLKTIGFEVPSE